MIAAVTRLRGEASLSAANGDEVANTKHEKPIGANRADEAAVDEALERLRHLRKSTMLRGLSWKELRDDGRK